ncbi:MAG: chemotaxis protein [Magnetococcales bacterium]|nr:chemotaxis protein [Magnetococcales bacterium]
MNEQERAIAQEIKSELHREVANLRVEVGQIRDIVQDAIGKLTNSFSGLRDQSNTQQALVTSIISSTADTTDEEEGDSEEPEHKRINIRQFVSETDQILRSFVDHILMVSRQSMEMVHRIDDLSNQMKEIVHFLKDINAIAEQTNVLALNARIVAARAGEAGRSFAVVADEVRKLSRNSNQFSGQISNVIRRSQQDIEAAKSIIEVMASKDMSFAIESKGRVDEMMEEVSEIDRFTSITLEKVSNLTLEINNSVGMAVMSLQFEDMVSQLSHSMENKFQMLEAFADSLCCGCLDEGQSHEERIVQIKEALQEQIDRFDEVDRRAVGQTNMDEGDVELF